MHKSNRSRPKRLDKSSTWIHEAATQKYSSGGGTQILNNLQISKQT